MEENSPKEKKFFGNIVLKIISVVLAIILWLIVMNIEDYSVTRTIRNIPVDQLNGSSIEKMGKVYDVISGDTVDVVVKGPRSVVDNLTVDSFQAEADLSQLSITNSAQINVHLRDSRDRSKVEISCINNTMNLTVEDRITKELAVKAVVEGTPAEGYAIGTSAAKPNIIEISGPSSIVNRVTDVRAIVDVTDLSDSLETTVTPVCLNAYGEMVNSQAIILGEDKVKVNVSILPTKKVPVHVEIVGEPAKDYVVTEMNYSPQEITISAPESILEDVKEIRVDDIELAGISEDAVLDVALDKYLPEGAFLTDKNEYLAVNIGLEAVQEKEITVEKSDVAFRNADEQYIYDLQISGVYKIRLKGLAARLDQVTKESLNLYLNLDGKKEGTQDVSPVYSKPEGVTVTLVGHMTLSVKKRPETMETGDGQDNGDGSGTGEN